MSERGFESLADGTLLLTVLLVASGAMVALARPVPVDETAVAARYAEDLRLALFRTTMDGLEYDRDGASVPLPDRTSVEMYLRVQVHLLTRGPPGLDFDESNARVEALAERLLRPGWGFAILGRVSGAGVLAIPHAADLPTTYVESSWTYPALDGTGPEVRLALAVWLSPR